MRLERHGALPMVAQGVGGRAETAFHECSCVDTWQEGGDQTSLFQVLSPGLHQLGLHALWQGL